MLSALVLCCNCYAVDNVWCSPLQYTKPPHESRLIVGNGRHRRIPQKVVSWINLKVQHTAVYAFKGSLHLFFPFGLLLGMFLKKVKG